MGKIDVSGFRFIDMGCGMGRSLKLYGPRFDAGGRGLGLDISEDKVRQARQTGYQAEVCDLCHFEASGRVDFTIISHVLEHIASTKDVRRIVKKALAVSRDFVLIVQPWFDADPYLFREGLKLYWSDWHGHPNHMTLLEFRNMLQPLFEADRVKRYTLYGSKRIVDSSDSAVLNRSEPVNQHEWTEGQHGAKRRLVFQEPVFREVLAILDVNGKSTQAVRKRFKKGLQPVYDSSESPPRHTQVEDDPSRLQAVRHRAVRWFVNKI
jgi:SAM-dependent methyltransferase